MNKPSRVNVYAPSDYLKQGAHYAALGGLAGVAGYLASPVVFAVSLAASVGSAIGIAALKALPVRETRKPEHAKLRTAINEMSALAGSDLSVKLQSLGRCEDRRLTADSNGTGKPVIGMSDTMLDVVDFAQQEAVAAHEMAHIIGRHSAQRNAELAIKATPLCAGLGSIAVGSAHNGALMLAAYGTAVLIGKSLQRRQDGQCDRNIGAFGADPLAMITFLKDGAATDRADGFWKADLQDWHSGSPAARLAKMVISPLKVHLHVSRRIGPLARQAAANGSDPEVIDAVVRQPAKVVPVSLPRTVAPGA